MSPSAVVKSLERLIDTGIFCFAEVSGPLFLTAYRCAVIDLSDLAQQLDLLGDITEDVDQAQASSLQELLRKARNATAHATSGYRYLPMVGGGRGVGLIIVPGYAKGNFGFSGTLFDNPYEDDIAIWSSSVRVYVQRNVLRAYEVIRDFVRKTYAK